MTIQNKLSRNFLSKITLKLRQELSLPLLKNFQKFLEIPGSFLPFFPERTSDIVLPSYRLVSGWMLLEDMASYPYRRMQTSSKISCPPEKGISYLVLVCTGSSDSECCLQLEGSKGSKSFVIRPGHQLLVVNRAEISSPNEEEVTFVLSGLPVDVSGGVVGVKFHEIASTGSLGYRGRSVAEQRSSTAALRTTADLDRFIGVSHHFAALSNNALLDLFERFHYEFPKPPSDPYSEAYVSFWKAQYAQVCGRPYSTAYESHDFEERFNEDVYPYCTRMPGIVGDQLIGVGSILKAMKDLPANGSVLEMGVGWGNTALQIGLSGFKLTVLDIEARFLSIVQSRFRKENMVVEVVHGDFFAAKAIDQKFDAILFYECFHHCINHQDLLVMLREKITDDGLIIFAGETISETYPHAWGLNDTGQGIWSIRHHGWMELCFSQHYFIELLKRTGFTVTKHECPQTSAGVVFVAKKTSATQA
jgi:Methyltransferase domain